jgi:NADPH:quinone reductase-like Zn-dependent oxidoreductase
MILALFVDQTFAVFLARMEADDLAVLAEMMAAGQVKPVIDRRFSLAETADAIRYSESDRARGKIIIKVNGQSAEATP